MPDAPRPITSPPAQPWQPWDASNDSGGDPQSSPTQIYDAAGSTGGSEPWVKIRPAGAINMSTGVSQPGKWPGDGASDGGTWKQT